MLLHFSRIRLLATCAVVVVATASCGGASSPTAPSPQPQIPNVAGTYKGGSLPSSPVPLARIGQAGLGRKTPITTVKNGKWVCDTPP